jgi:hypothetical protein
MAQNARRLPCPSGTPIGHTGDVRKLLMPSEKVLVSATGFCYVNIQRTRQVGSWPNLGGSRSEGYFGLWLSPL